MVEPRRACFDPSRTGLLNPGQLLAAMRVIDDLQGYFATLADKAPASQAKAAVRLERAQRHELLSSSLRPPPGSSLRVPYLDILAGGDSMAIPMRVAVALGMVLAMGGNRSTGCDASRLERADGNCSRDIDAAPAEL